jgi:hypothetical protein
MYQVTFMSSESLTRIVGCQSLDHRRDKFRVSTSSGLFRIDIDDGGVELKFSGQMYSEQFRTMQ